MSFVTEEDFETDVFEAGVNVFFKPTKSHYSFFRLGPDNQVVRFAPLSRDATIRHTGPTGDTAGYDPEQVLDMAYQAALKADKESMRVLTLLSYSMRLASFGAIFFNNGPRALARGGE
jgi:hypothetical protein